MRQESQKTKWYTVIFSKRWLSYLLLVVIFAGTCVGLSMWQFARRAEAQLEIQRVLDNYNSAPVPLTQALPNLDSFDEDLKWVPVIVQGTYLEDEQLLVRSRPREGLAGVEVLTPLLLDNGNIFIVDRGWLPVNEDPEKPYDIPAPPQGEVEVVARLKAGEPGIPGREMSSGQVATIELPLIESVLDQDTYTGAYGLLDSESPAPTEDRPLPAPEPRLDEGAHLSYALQWIMFGVLAFIALFWAIRNELKIRRGQQKPRQKRKPTEEDIEDAILDKTF